MNVPTGSTYKAKLSAEDIGNLVDWFTESYESGWRPTIQSHRVGKSATISAPWMEELQAKIEKIANDDYIH